MQVNTNLKLVLQFVWFAKLVGLAQCLVKLNRIPLLAPSATTVLAEQQLPLQTVVLVVLTLSEPT